MFIRSLLGGSLLPTSVVWLPKKRRKTKLRVEKARQQTTKKREKCWRKQKKKQKSRNYTNFFLSIFSQLKSLQCPFVDT